MKSKKKRGRPPLGGSEGKRHPLNMRTTKETRAWLEAAAAASGRSLTQEVEFQIESARWNELAHKVIMENIYKQFGGEDTYCLMNLLARALCYVEAETEKSWLTDKETYYQVLIACTDILRRYGPEHDQPTMRTTNTTPVGEKIAGVLVNLLEGTQTRDLLKKRGTPKASSKTLEK